MLKKLRLRQKRVREDLMMIIIRIAPNYNPPKRKDYV